jgi:DNA topoisomerase IA
VLPEKKYTGGYRTLTNCDSVGISTLKVASQWFRTVLDRMIGFPLSNYVRNKFEGAKSAGRVQSIPLILLIMRKDDIANFVPKTS